MMPRSYEKKDSKAVVELSQPIQNAVDAVFEAQFRRDQYEALFKTTRGEALGLIDAPDSGVNIGRGEPLRTINGTISLGVREHYHFNIPAMAELVKAGTVSVDAFVACLKDDGFKHDAVTRQCAGFLHGENPVMTQENSTDYTIFKATPDMKTRCQERMDREAGIVREHDAKVLSLAEAAKKLSKPAKKAPAPKKKGKRVA